MPIWSMRTTAHGPYFSDPNIFGGLRGVVDNADVLIFKRNGYYHVNISYGSAELDEDVRRRFDEAEFGTWETLTGALRYALGAHYSPG